MEDKEDNKDNPEEVVFNSGLDDDACRFWLKDGNLWMWSPTGSSQITKDEILVLEDQLEKLQTLIRIAKTGRAEAIACNWGYYRGEHVSMI